MDRTFQMMMGYVFAVASNVIQYIYLNGIERSSSISSVGTAGCENVLKFKVVRDKADGTAVLHRVS